MILPSRDFDWDSDHDIVINKQMAIAIYLNGKNDIVIRQERSYDDDSDYFVVVPREHARRLAQAIMQASGTPEMLALPAPSHSNRTAAAERQRRYRKRHHRDVETVTSDVMRDGVTQERHDITDEEPQLFREAAE